MATLKVVNINDQVSGVGGVGLESQKRPLTDEEIDEIVDYVIPRVRSILAEPFLRYEGTPSEVVGAAVGDYLANYYRERESEILTEIKTDLLQRKALEKLKAQIEDEDATKDIRDAIQLLYDMQLSELEQLRKALRIDLLEAELYPELIPELKENLWVQYRGAEISPGTSVGNIATDAVSAPAVQLTLDTFHATGSVMTVDSGLELLKSVLYATKKVKNPIMTVHFKQTEHIYEEQPKSNAKKSGKKSNAKKSGRVVRKEYISFEKVLTEKRAEMRQLTFFDVMEAETVDTRANIVGPGRDRTPWWYGLYGETYHYDVKPIGENQYMMRIELNMNELYLSKIDQFEIARILTSELTGVQIIPSPVLKYPARFSDIYVPEEGDLNEDFDNDREVLVPVIYIDVLPETGNQDAEETPFYRSDDYRKLTETVMNSFHSITIKGIPGIMEVTPGKKSILEVITASLFVGDAEEAEELYPDAEEFWKHKHGAAGVRTGIRAYEAKELATERSDIGFLAVGKDSMGEILHFPSEKEEASLADAKRAGKKALDAWKKKRRLVQWQLSIDRIGMRMKGFKRSRIEDALEYAGARVVDWIDEDLPANYVPQTDTIVCLCTRNPREVLQEIMNKDEQLAIEFTRKQMMRKVELYKEAKFQEAKGVSVERASTILERICFTALADVSGYNLEKVWAISSVDASLTYCNDMRLLFEMLGIEALRNYNEEMLYRALESAASAMDLRHINLIVDMTTRRGVHDSIKIAGLRNQNIPAISKAALEDPLGCIAKAASTGEISTLNNPYAALLFGQVPSNHPALPEITMTPEYEEIYHKAMENRAIKPEEIDESLWNDMYQPEIVIAEEGGKIKTLQGGTVQREDVLVPVTKPQRAVVKAGSVLQHSVKDRMGRIDDWIAPMGAVSTYTAKSMAKIAADEKRAIAEGNRESPKQKEEKKYTFEPFKPLKSTKRELVGVSDVPEGGKIEPAVTAPPEAITFPQFSGKTPIKKILAQL